MMLNNSALAPFGTNIMFLTVLITVSCDSKVPSADTPRIMSNSNPQSDHNEDKEKLL